MDLDTTTQINESVLNQIIREIGNGLPQDELPMQNREAGVRDLCLEIKEYIDLYGDPRMIIPYADHRGDLYQAWVVAETIAENSPAEPISI